MAVDHDEIRAALSAYKDGEVSGKLKNLIFRHLQVCDDCGEQLRELDRIDSLVRRLPGICASEDFVSQVIARTRAVDVPDSRRLSLPRSVISRFLSAADRVFELFPGYRLQSTGSLDEFGDSPPLSLSHAYFQLIGLQQ
jgi:anti-sigma factor RsiW